MLKKKKTTASGKLVLVKSVRRTRSHRMKFCVHGTNIIPSQKCSKHEKIHIQPSERLEIIQ